MAREVRDILPQNPDPKPITYKDARQIVQTLVDDLNKAEATLAEVEDENVKLPLHVGLITHGRELCEARAPKCDECPIALRCRYVDRRAP